MDRFHDYRVTFMRFFIINSRQVTHDRGWD